MLKWLLARVQKQESPVSQNKQYAAEVLAILLQSSSANRVRISELDGVDILLQLLSAYRKRDPLKDSEEEEFVENLFDCMICIVGENVGKQKFILAEGVELCLIMLREGRMSKPRALRLLDHAMGGPDGREVCEKLVEAAGLKGNDEVVIRQAMVSFVNGRVMDLAIHLDRKMCLAGSAVCTNPIVDGTAPPAVPPPRPVGKR